MATFALPNVQPRVREIGNAVGNMFNVTNIGGWRATDPYPDHPSGWALDYMVYGDKAKGDRIAEYHIANAATLGVDYLIWYDRVWSPDRGWRAYQPGNAGRHRHMDHVHVTYVASSGTIPGATNLGLGNPLNPVDDLLSKLPVLKEVEKISATLDDPLFWRRVGVGALGVTAALVAIAFVRRGM